MVEFNERKKQVLQEIENSGTVFSDEIAEALSISLNNSCMRLLMCFRYGLLKRDWVFRPDRRSYSWCYYMTEKGSKRLQYYLELDEA